MGLSRRPLLAAPALIDDRHGNHDPAWAADGKPITVACGCRLVVDKLMIPTHETFVHGSSVGNRAVAEAPFVTTHGDRFETVTPWMQKVEPPPLRAAQLLQARSYRGRVDRWRIIRFEASCTGDIDVGVAPAVSGAVPTAAHCSDRSQVVEGFVRNTVTPQTDGSCLHFWAFERNDCLAEHRLTRALREGLASIFGKDEAVPQAQQRAIDACPGHRFDNSTSTLARWARASSSTA